MLRTGFQIKYGDMRLVLKLKAL